MVAQSKISFLRRNSEKCFQNHHHHLGGGRDFISTFGVSRRFSLCLKTLSASFLETLMIKAMQIADLIFWLRNSVWFGFWFFFWLKRTTIEISSPSHLKKSETMLGSSSTGDPHLPSSSLALIILCVVQFLHSLHEKIKYLEEERDSLRMTLQVLCIFP